MIGHDLVWYYTGPPDGLLKEGLSTGGVAVLAQQDVDDNTLLIDGAVQVELVSLTEQEHLADEPAPANPTPTAPDLGRQLRPEGLDPIQDCPM
jgi:hypothetical protein